MIERNDLQLQVIKANDDLTPEHHQFFLYQMLRGLKYIHTGKVLSGTKHFAIKSLGFCYISFGGERMPYAICNLWVCAGTVLLDGRVIQLL